MSFIATNHKTPYPAISPTRPELAQTGQTVLVTGGAQGVGYSISKAFAQAGAATIIIVSRRLKVMEDAATRIKTELPSFTGRIVSYVCDVGDLRSTAELWETLKTDGLVVDVLVLNVAASACRGRLVDVSLAEIWGEFEVNVRGNIDFAQRFFKQNDTRPNGRSKVLLNVSTFAIYDFVVTAGKPNYPLTKNAGTLAIQQIAKDVAVDKVQIVSFHPGGIFTDAARASGLTKDSYPWDDDGLPGAFAVWAASKEARFLHGRFVHSSWDVEEMQNGLVAARIAEDPSFLKIGVLGLVGTSATIT